MRTPLAALGLLLALAAAAFGQVSQFPQTLPPNTVVGRLGAGVPGPSQAIPFGTLGTQISPFVLASLPPYNVSASASDNSAGILAAINAAKTLGIGASVYLPSGTLKACSQMQWSGNGISIIGGGQGTSPYAPASTGGTVIQACSSFSGTEQVLFGANSSSAVNYGGSISNISFDGNGVASIGLLLRDVLGARFDNLSFYNQSGSGLEINGTSGNSVAVTSRNVFTSLNIKERNNSAGLTTNGISCLTTTQNNWISIFIDHANGDAIHVGENCDQQYWQGLVTFRANAETGYAINLTGDSSSVIGNWSFNGISTSAQWNMACCSAANVGWTVLDLATGGFNSGVTESNLITGTGTAGVAYIDQGGNLLTGGQTGITISNSQNASTQFSAINSNSGTSAAASFSASLSNVANSSALFQVLNGTAPAGQINTGSGLNIFSLAMNGTAIETLTKGGGVQIGAPTGGDLGAGTVNIASSVKVSTANANVATFGNGSLGGTNTPTSVAFDASFANTCGNGGQDKIYLLGTSIGAYGIGVCSGTVWFGSGGTFAWYNNSAASVATLDASGNFATNVSVTSKRVTGSGSTPTANSCTGFALATGSSDFAGKVTFNSATTCSISFGSSFTNTPFCVVTPGSAASTVEAVPSTGGLAVTFGTANTAFQYICAGT